MELQVIWAFLKLFSVSEGSGYLEVLKPDRSIGGM